MSLDGKSIGLGTMRCRGNRPLKQYSICYCKSTPIRSRTLTLMINPKSGGCWRLKISCGLLSFFPLFNCGTPTISVRPSRQPDISVLSKFISLSLSPFHGAQHVCRDKRETAHNCKRRGRGGGVEATKREAMKKGAERRFEAMTSGRWNTFKP